MLLGVLFWTGHIEKQCQLLQRYFGDLSSFYVVFFYSLSHSTCNKVCTYHTQYPLQFIQFLQVDIKIRWSKVKAVDLYLMF